MNRQTMPLGWLGLMLLAGACSGEKVAIGGDRTGVDVGGAGATGGSTGSGGSGMDGSGGSSAGSGTDGSGGSNGGGSGTDGSGGSSGGGPQICGLPLDGGPCFAAMTRWGFDPAAGRCVTFTYGGCAGNANNFTTLEACALACGNPDCGADDAAGEGNCRLDLGFKWDGSRCVNLGGCRCVGSDCGTLTDFETCVAIHASCPGAPRCVLEQQAVLDYIDANKACTTNEDCLGAPVGCGITEDDCTNTVYVNRNTDLARLGSLRDALSACMAMECPPTCERMPTPALCVAGHCLREES